MSDHPLLQSLGKKPRGGKVGSCAHCGKEFYQTPSQAARSKRFFCSVEHSVQSDKDHAFRFNCMVCAKVVFTQPAQMKYRNRRTCSRECNGKVKTAIAERRRIENPPTEAALRRRIRYSKKMADWRKAVFERDNYTCQICSARNGNGKYIVLNADHIKPFAEFPALRFELSNGRTLCVTCHRKTETWGQKRKKAPSHPNLTQKETGLLVFGVGEAQGCG